MCSHRTVRFVKPRPERSHCTWKTENKTSRLHFSLCTFHLQGPLCHFYIIFLHPSHTHVPSKRVSPSFDSLSVTPTLAYTFSVSMKRFRRSVCPFVQVPGAKNSADCGESTRGSASSVPEPDNGQLKCLTTHRSSQSGNDCPSLPPAWRPTELKFGLALKWGSKIRSNWSSDQSGTQPPESSHILRS